jgi:hypothetical protein
MERIVIRTFDGRMERSCDKDSRAQTSMYPTQKNGGN